MLPINRLVGDGGIHRREWGWWQNGWSVALFFLSLSYVAGVSSRSARHATTCNVPYQGAPQACKFWSQNVDAVQPALRGMGRLAEAWLTRCVDGTQFALTGSASSSGKIGLAYVSLVRCFQNVVTITQVHLCANSSVDLTIVQITQSIVLSGRN